MVCAPRAHQFDLAARDGGGDGIGAGFDTVGHHGMFGAVQRLDAFDRELRRAQAGDLRAHRDQAMAEIRRSPARAPHWR